ncbi:MAG: thioredoxin domain-containing protein [Gemmatimonadetes bacterium]|nr:thioredoxin domain-containing protein [Gemmatimonadota bacterium]
MASTEDQDHASESREDHTRTDQAPRRRPARLYAGIGALALAGILLVASNLLLSLVQRGARSTGAAPRTLSPPSNPRFPAQFDTLGVALGAADAPVVVREFGDFQCPPCQSFTSTLARLREEHIARGLVRFVFFDFPIADQHPNALAAAQAARCAERQGAYWAMRDALFERQSEWAAEQDPLPLFRRYASELGYDGEAVLACVRARETAMEVQRSLSFALALGVRSTPTLVVGDAARSGAVSWEELAMLVEAELRGSSGALKGLNSQRTRP